MILGQGERAVAARLLPPQELGCGSKAHQFHESVLPDWVEHPKLLGAMSRSQKGRIGNELVLTLNAAQYTEARPATPSSSGAPFWKSSLAAVGAQGPR